MYVDAKIINVNSELLNDYNMISFQKDILFEFQDAIYNNIYFSIVNSSLRDIKKLSDSSNTIMIIKDIIKKATNWIVEVNRLKSINVIVEKQSDSRVNISVEGFKNDKNFIYNYYYNF